MEELLKKINNKNNSDNSFKKKKKQFYYNTKRHDLYLRILSILAKQKVKKYYKNLVIRLFTYFFVYLEKIDSKSLNITIKNNIKYYYSARLYIKDAEDLFLNMNLANSTKLYYLNIIRKYLKILNKNNKIHFYNTSNLYQKNKNNLAFQNRTIIQKLKDYGNVEYLCSYYCLYFLGISYYQLSKLTYNNIKQDGNIICFISYKSKRKILKKKKIHKSLKPYFNEFYQGKNLFEYLFFKDIKDKENGETRKNQIKITMTTFLKKTLKIPSKKLKEFNDFVEDERPSIKFGSNSKYYFNQDITLIANDPLSY